MHKITININQSIYEHIMFFLKNLPKHLIDIQSETKVETLSTASKPSSNTDAFGILKGRIKNPVQWQKEIREESERDVYKDFK